MGWFANSPPPLHPTLIYGEYKGKSLPIVSIKDQYPEVLVDGKIQRLALKSRYQPRRGVAFAPGHIELSRVNLNSSKRNLVYMFGNGSEVNGGTLSADSEFSATVQASQAYTNCYVAIIFFEQAFLEGGTDQPQATVQFKQIKNLSPGQNRIKTTFGYMDFGERKIGFFPLFFTGGVEIKSDQHQVIAQFFRRMEMMRHETYVKDYVQKHAGESKPLDLYLQIPPLFPDGTDFSTVPANVKASFMVSEEGTVESLQFQEQLTPEIGSSLRRTLKSWLFFPRLKEGRPTRTMVTVPIVLKPDEPTKAPS